MPVFCCLWGCGHGAERHVHHIHRPGAAVGLGWRSPAERRVWPLGSVEADPLADDAPGLEAVGELILLSHNTGASGRDTSHQNSCLSATKELTRVKPDAFLWIDQRHGATKEPSHLIPEPRPISSRAAAVTLHAEFVHELIQRPPENQLTALRPHRL